MEPLTDEQAHQVYTWVDKHTLSRPKRNISRDFADGVCVAEILKFYFPQFVDLHNYVSAFSQRQKVENWLTMKQKVFRKISLDVDPKDLTDIANAVPGAIERFLLVLMHKIPQIQARLQQVRGNSASQSREVSPERQRSNSTAKQRSASERPLSARGAGGAAAHQQQQQNQQQAAADGNGAAVAPHTIMVAKDHEISNLRESVRLLTAKIRQLEELLKLRDSKIRILQDQVVTLQGAQ